MELLLPLLLLPEIPRTLLIFCIPKQAFCIVSFCKNATICNANKCMQFQMSNSNLQRLVGQCLLNQFLGAPSFFNIIYHVREFPNKSMIPSSLTLNIQSAIKRRRQQQQQQQHNINRINSLDNTAPPINTSHPHSPIHSVASSK